MTKTLPQVYDLEEVLQNTCYTPEQIAIKSSREELLCLSNRVVFASGSVKMRDDLASYEILFPTLQFDEDGSVKPVIVSLLQLAKKHDWAISDVAIWLYSPTDYLEGKLPADFVDTDPVKLLTVAENAWGVEW